MPRNLLKTIASHRVFSSLLVLGGLTLAGGFCLPASQAAEPGGAKQADTAEEHPIEPALRFARAALKEIDKIADYTATISKRERIGNTLKEYEFMSAKIRHEPFSVYLKFLAPEKVKGREVIYDPANNNGNLISHEAGLLRNLGTMTLKPDGLLAMQGQLYPITDIGIKNLVVKLLERGEKEKQLGGSCQVKFYKNAKIDGRSATCIEVLHPERHETHDFYRARVFVDDELKIPIRYEAHGFPAKPGDEPPLLEEYTYTNIKLNVGLTDADFSKTNPAYDFP